MNRSEAVAIIQEEFHGDKDEAQAEKYLDKLIDLCEPQYDPLKDPDGTVDGSLAEHLRSMTQTFYKNEKGLW